MNDHNDEDKLGFLVEFSDDEVRTLLYAVKEAIRLWPGYPARPLEEQGELCRLRDQLFMMTLEMQWGPEA